MSAQPPSTISELFIRIARDRADLEEWTSTLTKAQLSAPGKDGWAIKDHLNHLSMWELSTAALLRGDPRFAMMGIKPSDPEPDDVDGLNAQIFAQNKDRSVEDALALFHNAHMELLGELAQLSDVDLLKPYLHFQPNEKGDDEARTILDEIAGNTYEHYVEHIQWINEFLTQR